MWSNEGNGWKYLPIEWMGNNNKRGLYGKSFGKSTAEEVNWFREWLTAWKKKVWMLGEQGEWCMIGMNGRGLGWENGIYMTRDIYLIRLS